MPHSRYEQGRWRLANKPGSHICSTKQLFDSDSFTAIEAGGQTYKGCEVMGTGDVSIFVEDPEDGSCKRIDLKDVLFIPGYCDDVESQVTHLMIARGILKTYPSQRVPNALICEFENDDGRPSSCLGYAGQQGMYTIEMCRRSQCRPRWGMTHKGDLRFEMRSEKDGRIHQDG